MKPSCKENIEESEKDKSYNHTLNNFVQKKKIPENYIEIKEGMMDVLETKNRGPTEIFEKIVKDFDEIGSTYGKSQDLIIFSQKQHIKVY